MKLRLVATLLLLQICYLSYSQSDSILHQGVYRPYLLHLPAGYNPLIQYPLVINMHGYGSNSAEQMFYSQFNTVADTAQFIVVYPNGINEQWDLAGNRDVTFLKNLVDTLKNKFSTSNCIFSTGMSMGGFMSYKLACEFAYPIAAIAVVTGNMPAQQQSNCNPVSGVPVMHFHGTADAVVNYNGGFGLPPVDSTISWWVKSNQCSTPPVVTALPDINTADNCTAERQYFGNGRNNSELTFYKIYNGGHTWPGSLNIPLYGNTCQDINASALIGAFFKKYCGIINNIGNKPQTRSLQVYPNPASNALYIDMPDLAPLQLRLYNSMGQQVYAASLNAAPAYTIDISALPGGIYTVQAISGHTNMYTAKLSIQR